MPAKNIQKAISSLIIFKIKGALKKLAATFLKIEMEYSKMLVIT
jgi:hypothetical protein